MASDSESSQSSSSDSSEGEATQEYNMQTLPDNLTEKDLHEVSIATYNKLITFWCLLFDLVLSFLDHQG